MRKKLIGLGVPADRLTVEFFGEDTSEVAPGDLFFALGLPKIEDVPVRRLTCIRFTSDREPI